MPRSWRGSAQTRVTVRSVRIPVVCLVLLTACYSPVQPECGFTCGPSGECPTGYFCATDMVCHRDGTSPTAGCEGRDARPDTPRPIDAPPSDADTGPLLVVTNPMPNETNVPTTTTVYVQFNEPVLGVNTTSFTVSAGVAVAGTLTPVDTRTYVFAPTAALPAAIFITVSLSNVITDTSGNPFVGAIYQFETAP